MAETSDEAPERKPLSPRAQMTLVALGTALSLLVNLVLQQSIPRAATPDGYFWTCAILVVLLPAVLVAVASNWLEFSQFTSSSRSGLWEGREGAAAQAWAILLYIQVLGSFAVLAWHTTFTGGAWQSPFAPTIFVMVVVAPSIARSPGTAWLVFLMALILSLIFSGQLNFVPVSPVLEVPLLVSATALLVNAFLGFLLPMAARRWDRKRREAQRRVTESASE